MNVPSPRFRKRLLVRRYVFASKLLDLVVDVRVGGEEVLPPVVVEVDEAVAPPAAGGHQRAQPRAMGHVLEEALPQVPVQAGSSRPPAR